MVGALSIDSEGMLGIAEHKGHPPLSTRSLDDGEKERILRSSGAGDGIRTRDVLLGRQELYR